MLGWFFASSPPPLEDQVKEWRKRLRVEARSVDREARKLQRQEERALREVKLSLRRGQTNAAKLMVREVITLQRGVSRLFRTKAQLNSVNMQLGEQMMRIKVTKSIAYSAQAMRAMNRLMRVKEISITMRELGKQMEKAGFLQEMIDDVMGDDEDELEGDVEEEVAKIMDELAAEALMRADRVPSTGGVHIFQPVEVKSVTAEKM